MNWFMRMFMSKTGGSQMMEEQKSSPPFDEAQNHGNVCPNPTVMVESVYIEDHQNFSPWVLMSKRLLPDTDHSTRQAKFISLIQLYTHNALSLFMWLPLTCWMQQLASLFTSVECIL